MNDESQQKSDERIHSESRNERPVKELPRQILQGVAHDLQRFGIFGNLAVGVILLLVGPIVLYTITGLRGAVIFAGIGLTLALWILIGVILNQISVNKQGITNTPILKHPTFQQTPERFSVSAGGNTTMATKVALEGTPIEVTPEINKLKPVLMYVRNGTLFVDVTFYRPELPYPFEIKNNNYDVIPPDCELNSNEVALEIVDRNKVPILQIIYETPTHIVVNGLFGLPPNGSSSLVVDQKGIRLSSEL
ncbi:MAG TPA: hypothetical protein VE056_10520 [Pyrinomonadaceae bacterium]|nr:hypothetical protein [Pyrinomonadaceae bacterium]